MGLVLAGFIRLRHGLDRSLRDLFDQLYSAPASLIDDLHCQQLAKLSGGVLRDLLTLAQAAVRSQ